MQVISLLPDRLYPKLQATSTLRSRSTGSEVNVFRLKLKVSGSPVHFSENTMFSDVADCNIYFYKGGSFKKFELIPKQISLVKMLFF